MFLKLGNSDSCGIPSPTVALCSPLPWLRERRRPPPSPGSPSCPPLSAARRACPGLRPRPGRAPLSGVPPRVPLKASSLPGRSPRSGPGRAGGGAARSSASLTGRVGCNWAQTRTWRCRARKGAAASSRVPDTSPALKCAEEPLRAMGPAGAVLRRGSWSRTGESGLLRAPPRQSGWEGGG